MARVLIVEDERVSADEIASLVREAGHNVVGVSASGEQALALAVDTTPDLALVDVKLQGEMDGIGLARSLQDRLDLPVVYVTGRYDDEILQRAASTFAQGYLLKPVDGRALEACIEMTLARRGRDRSLRAQGQWLSQLLQSAGVAIVATDLERMVRYANRQALQLAGHGQGEPFDSFPALVDRHGAAFDPVAQALARGACVEFPPGSALQRSAGERVPVEGSAAPLLDDQEQPCGVVVAVSDATERRNAERDRLRGQRLDALATLAAGIAHDLNNTLAIMVNCASLARRILQHPEIDGLLDDLGHAGERARSLTTQLTAFARGGYFVRQQLELRPILERTIGLSLAGSSVCADFEIDDDLWPVLGDETSLAQVFANLAENGREAMAGGGVLTVRAKNQELDEADPLLPAGRYVAVTITDQGVRLPGEQLDRIFDPFFASTRHTSGLGLASAHSIVVRHGGALRAQAELGLGTSFSALLPAAPPVSERRDSTSVPASTPRTDKVLVMDDEPALRRVLALCLRDMGYRVVVAAHGREAVDRYCEARAEGDPFGAVILDLTVRGGMGGLDALERLREIDPAVRAIAASGYSDSPVLEEFERFGFAGALAKPFHFTMLVNLLRQIVESPA